ncbi:hypothetical protein O3G_MSEX014421 [Manduca sexta]|uniref:Uncharacterized protein n=1 Tax=Manduca sexta TaxID=7130 RepID=A0A922D005_MANSE|nr:hypothetical protein O3G_MSEX014421 [Manduca sexta]
MYTHSIFVILILLLFELQSSNSQFPKHIDLLKLGDVNLNGNKYKLLKPTNHIITDYFKHFMLGQIRRYPNEKVFIDDNGFRHDWDDYKNSRKHYIFQKATTLKEIKLTDYKGNKIIEENKKLNETKVRKKPRRKKKVIEEEEKREKISLREGGRTVARTTFFCPFFGVITMSSYLD